MNDQLDEREKIDKALETRLRFEGLLSDLSARFVRVSADRLDGEIANALKAVLEFFQVDRCGLLLTLPDRSGLQVTYAQYANDQVMSVPVGTIVTRTRFPWAFEQLVEKRQIVAFSSTDDLPPEAQVDRESWMAQGTRSTLLIPIYTGGSVVYTIVINAMKNEQVWPEEFLPRLRLFGEILVNALERRIGEEALKKEEAKYRLIFDGALEGLFESSPEGKVLSANAALSRMLGYESPEELTSMIRNVGKQIWVDEQERADYVQRLEKQGVILKHECRFRRRDGSEIWVSLSTRFATGPEGQTFYSGFVEDITERRRAEEALGERLRFEKLISDLSARFVNIPPEQVDSEIENGLRQILELFQVDRCALLRLLPAQSTYQITHAASSDHVPPVTAGGELPSSLYPWAYVKLAEKQEVVSVSRLDDLPPEAAADRQTCIERGIRSYLNIPILIGEGVDVIYASSVKSERIWPEAYFPRLRLLGEVFVNALERRKNRLELEEQLRFEMVLAEISGRFVNLSAERLDSEIVDAERRICESLGFDVAGLWQWSDEVPGSLLLTHLYGAVEAPLPERMEASEYFPWYQQQLLAGRVVAFSSLEELPPEAGRDADSCRHFGIKSNLTIPLAMGGKPPIGALGFNTTRSERNWPGALVKRLQLIAQIFMNALARKRADETLRKHLKEIEVLRQRLEKENIYLREDLRRERGFGKIIGSSEALNYVMFRVGQVAPTDATVLILGETGTGKGMVANAIHDLSRRKERLMITVNCAALPGNLIESELFGREKGAFTGAHARQSGRFEAADGGTIFLDEIGELPLELQSKLLRVLQDGEFERLGSARTVKVDVRVIASTSRNLKDEVAAGNFREDLFYRLNVFPVTIPPLRERADDIPELVRFFTDKYSRKIGKQIETIPKHTLKTLQEYPWPGNIRELEHVIERSVITTEGTVLQMVDYLEPVRGARSGRFVPEGPGRHGAGAHCPCPPRHGVENRRAERGSRNPQSEPEYIAFTDQEAGH